MRFWLHTLLVYFCFGLLLGRAGGTESRVQYVGGTVSAIPSGCDGIIQASDDVYFVFTAKKIKVRVPYERIHNIEYGQKVGRRYYLALVSPALALSKKRQHFLTIDFEDDEGKMQALVFQVDKNDIRATLASLEARTGQQVKYQDEEARKAGKG